MTATERTDKLCEALYGRRWQDEGALGTEWCIINQAICQAEYEMRERCAQTAELWSGPTENAPSIIASVAAAIRGIALLLVLAAPVHAAHCPPAKLQATLQVPEPVDVEKAEVLAELMRFPDAQIAEQNCAVAFWHWKYCNDRCALETDKEWWLLYVVEAERRYMVWHYLRCLHNDHSCYSLERLKGELGELRSILGAMPPPMPYLDDVW